MSSRRLDDLIRQARSAEAPSAGERAHVREALARRIARGEAGPDSDGTSLSPARAGTLPSGHGLARSWLGGAGAVSAGLGVLALGALAVYALGGRGLDGNARTEQAAREPNGSAEARPASAQGLNEPTKPDAALNGAASQAPSQRGLASDEALAPGRPDSTRPALKDVEAKAAATARSTNAGSAAKAAAAGAVPRATRGDGEAERRALARVQHALRDGRFAEAIAALERDDRTFASGALLEERAAARVLARCGNAETAEAQRLAAAFVAQYPSSPLRARVLASCTPSASERSR